jgi:Zn-dependent protease
VIVFRLGAGMGGSTAGTVMVHMGSAGVLINTALMVLNMLPLPPLDGGRIMTGLLPGPLAYRFSRLEPYGLFIMVALLATGLLSKIMWPPMLAFFDVLAGGIGVPVRYLFVAAG